MDVFDEIIKLHNQGNKVVICFAWGAKMKLEVTKIDEKHIYIRNLGSTSFGYPADRTYVNTNFEIFSHTANTVVTKKDSFKSNPAIQVSQPTKDLYSLFSAVSRGNCACNIPRHSCDYHREI